MNLIVMGKMASGKTTMADLLIKELPNGRRLTLAEPLKQVVADLDKIPDESLAELYILPFYEPRPNKDEFMKTWLSVLTDLRKIPHEEPKPRKRLQWLGTEGGRKRIDESLWVEIALTKARRSPKVSWVIDDCRFINEFQAFVKEGWAPIFLEVTPEVQHQRLTNLYGKYDPEVLKHPSETELDLITVDSKNRFDSNINPQTTLTEIKKFIWKNEGLS
jgi:hypothetical protein